MLSVPFRDLAQKPSMALDAGVKTSIYLRNLLSEMGIDMSRVSICSDSQFSITMVKNERITKRGKYIYHFLCDHVGRSVVMKFCPTEMMSANMLQKPLCYEKVLHRLQAIKM